MLTDDARRQGRIFNADAAPWLEQLCNYLYSANTKDTSVLCGSKRFDRVFFSEFFRAEKGNG